MTAKTFQAFYIASLTELDRLTRQLLAQGIQNPEAWKVYQEAHQIIEVQVEITPDNSIRVDHPAARPEGYPALMLFRSPPEISEVDFSCDSEEAVLAINKFALQAYVREEFLRTRPEFPPEMLEP